MLDDPDGTVRGRQELALVRNIVRSLGDPPGLGVEAGSRYQLTTYGLFGFAVISSSTAREAISVALGYRDLSYAFVEMAVEHDGDEVRMILDDRELPRDVRRFMVERDAAAICLLARELFGGSIALRRVAFRYPAPERPGPYEAAFGLVPEFGAARNLAAVDAALIDMPLPRASPHAARETQRQCRELLHRRRERSGLAGRVRDELVRDPRRMPSQLDMAQRLHLSTRTLRRQLAGEGTTFRGLVEETRALLAEELLAAGTLSIEEIADRLGYSEASSFVHAFTRWKGAPPRRYAITALSQP